MDCFFGPLVNFLSFQNEQVYGYKKLNLFCFNATVVHSMRFYTSDMIILIIHTFDYLFKLGCSLWLTRKFGIIVDVLFLPFLKQYKYLKIW